MKKVLVTGAGGFIGSHLTEFLVSKGYSVRAFIRYNSQSHWGWLENSPLKKEIEVHAGDIRDHDSVINAVQGCSTVFHLAALIGIPYSYLSPLAYIKTNIEGTYNILDACRRASVENILITSTSETYGSAQYVPIDEKHPSVGQSPYSASKIAADKLAESYYRSFNTPVKIVRPFNTFGPRQSARAIIPSIITQFLSGAEEINIGNTDPTRDLTFVEDMVEGFYAVSQCDACKGTVTNIGMNKEISIGGLLELIASLMNKQFVIKKDDSRIRQSSSEVNRLMCDNTKMIKLTGWKPKHDLESGLLKTISFLEENLELYKSELYNI